MPAPSMTAITRSTPGKTENGPSAATSARETRQPQAEPEPPPVASSRVTPPPFFHGTGAMSDVRTRRVEVLCMMLKEASWRAAARLRRGLDAHLVGIEGDVAFHRAGLRQRLLVAPGGVHQLLAVGGD